MEHTPEPEAEWGHDPHYIEQCEGDPDHVWQQNHVGVFYSADAAKSWRKVSVPEQGVHFGFPITADAKNGRTAWVVPGRSDQQRMAIDGGLFVARTEDGGQTLEGAAPRPAPGVRVRRGAIATPSPTRRASWRSAARRATSTSARTAGRAG